ncbi:unnamed protein product, partial [Sphacelaria rigidula]
AIGLAPGYSIQCTSSDHAVTQASDDIDAGSVSNNAILTGWTASPGSIKITTMDADIVSLPRQSAVFVVRTLQSMTVGAGPNTQYSDEGDVATFNITVSNTGNTRLRGVMVTDSMFDPEDLDCDQDFTDPTSSAFTPASDPDGASIVCIGAVSLTKSEVDAGGFEGTAKVS